MKKGVLKWTQKIHQFLARKQIPTLGHAPYSPDLNLCVLFFSPKVKCSFKGTHFQSIEDIHKKMAELPKVPHRMTSDVLRPGRLIWSSV
jgi:hypothetical protein